MTRLYRPGGICIPGRKEIGPVATRFAIFAKKLFDYLQIEPVFGFSGIVLEGNVMTGVAAGGLAGG